MEMRPSWAFLLFVFLGWVLGGALRRVWRKSRPIFLGILNMQCSAEYARKKSYQKHCLDQDNLIIPKIKFPLFMIIHTNYSKLKFCMNRFANKQRFKGYMRPIALDIVKSNITGYGIWIHAVIKSISTIISYIKNYKISTVNIFNHKLFTLFFKVFKIPQNNSIIPDFDILPFFLILKYH